MAVIYITEADETLHKFRMPAEEGFVATIGREDCLISLPNVLGISGLHCSIICERGRYFIRDEGSSNGTYVDGRAVGMEALRPGAVYVIGNAVLTFDPEIVPAAAPAPVAETPAPASPAPAAAAPAPCEGAPQEVPAPEPSGDAPQEAPAPLAADDETPLLAGRPVALCLNVLYVTVVLIMALYAGVALRQWVDGGSSSDAAAEVKN